MAGARRRGIAAGTSAPRERRRDSGQFATPAAVADLVIALTLRGDERRVLDPATGDGVFLRRTAAWAGAAGRATPALAGIELEPGALGDSRFPPGTEVITGDFLALPTTGRGGETAVDAVIGNPPYVRHERSGRPGSGPSDAVWPGFDVRLPRRADLSVAFLLRAGAHLATSGRVGFVTTSAWLDAEYLRKLQPVLLGPLRVLAVVGSACERWFPDAAVNTVVVVAERAGATGPTVGTALPRARSVRFVRLSRRLTDLVGPDDDPDHWDRLGALRGAVHGAGLLLPGVEVHEVPLQTLRGDGEHAALATRLGPRWGYHLRAPPVLRAVVERCGGAMAPLAEVATLRYGIKPGILGFFAPRPMDGALDRFGVEPRFRVPFLYSTRRWRRLVVTADDADRELVRIGDGPDRLDGTGAGRYVAWGAGQRTPAGVPYPEVPSVRLQRPGWYAVRADPAPGVVLPQFRDRRHLCPVNPGGLAVGNTAFEALPREEGADGLRLLGAALNTSLTALFLECLGRVNLGEGLLTVYGPDFADLPVVPPAVLRQRGAAEEVLAAFAEVARREDLPLEEELVRPDRARLERAILVGGLGLRPEELAAVQQEAVAAVRRRGTMARSVPGAARRQGRAVTSPAPAPDR